MNNDQQIISRIERVASIIAMDAKNVDNKMKAEEIISLISRLKEGIDEQKILYNM
jgi:hypothetical protein